MLAHNLGTQVDRLQLDYAFLFQCYDILEALGFCSKRMESKVEAKPENGWIALNFGAVNELGVPQRWSKHFKFVQEMAVAGDAIKESDTFKNSAPLRQLWLDLLYRMIRSEKIGKAELNALALQYFPKGGVRIITIIKKLLKWLGLIVKSIEDESLYNVNTILLNELLKPEIKAEAELRDVQKFLTKRFSE